MKQYYFATYLVVLTLFICSDVHSSELTNFEFLGVQHQLPSVELSDETITGIAGRGDQYGIAIDIDNDLAVIGAAKAKGHGVVYLYQFNGSNWEFIQYLEADDLTAGSFFGQSVDLEGNQLVVGAYHDGFDVTGSAYVFEYDNGQWEQTQKLMSDEPEYESHYGQSVKLFNDWLFVGASNESVQGIGSVGQVYVYRLINGDYQHVDDLTQPTPEWDSAFGVKIHIEDQHLFVGATLAEFSGRVYVFSLQTNQWVYSQTLNPTETIDANLFGVAISQYENTLAIGSPKSTGGVYLYEYVGGQWEMDQVLVASDRSEGDWYGVSVLLVNDQLVIGSYRDDEQVPNSGSVYVYEKVGSDWQETEKLQSILPTVDGRFGIDLAEGNETLLIGGYKQHGIDYNSGLVTSFGWDNGFWNNPS